jgi:flagellar assembly factor FliW
MTANLLAPIIINADKHLAGQVILPGDRYKTKHRLIEEAEEVSAPCSS